MFYQNDCRLDSEIIILTILLSPTYLSLKVPSLLYNPIYHVACEKTYTHSVHCYKRTNVDPWTFPTFIKIEFVSIAIVRNSASLSIHSFNISTDAGFSFSKTHLCYLAIIDSGSFLNNWEYMYPLCKSSAFVFLMLTSATSNKSANCSMFLAFFKSYRRKLFYFVLEFIHNSSFSSEFPF